MNEITKRIVQNLDELDKNCSRASIVLFSISIGYIALYYGAVTETPKVLGIQFVEKYLFYVGAVVIFAFFQYTLICGLGTVVLEKEILRQTHEVDPRLPFHRKPTMFSLLFIFGSSVRTQSARIIFWVQAGFVLLGLFLIPLAACYHITYWLFENHTSNIILIPAVLASVGCTFEAFFFSVAFLKKLVRYGKNQSR